jgi:hypothetical protein
MTATERSRRRRARIGSKTLNRTRRRKYRAKQVVLRKAARAAKAAAALVQAESERARLLAVRATTSSGAAPSLWVRSYRADPLVRPLADLHYNRQSPGAAQFTPPGRCVVLRTRDCDAFWVTVAPYARYTQHQWAGAWICSAFRNESSMLSSTLITQAVAASLALLGQPPTCGLVTFVDVSEVQSPNPGYCFKRAGFKFVGHTKSGLVALQLLPVADPPPQLPNGILL